MRWVVALLLIMLAACAQQTSEERPDLRLANVSESDGFSYVLEVCSDSELFSGSFVPFEATVGGRSDFVSSGDFMPVSEECVEIDYELDQDLREPLLARGEIVFMIDPRDTLNESDETNNRFVYEPERVCIDADGDNPFLSAYVTATLDGEALYVLDSCANATAIEYACAPDSSVDVIRYNCTDGCAAGSCRCLNSATCFSDGSAVPIES